MWNALKILFLFSEKLIHRLCYADVFLFFYF